MIKGRDSDGSGADGRGLRLAAKLRENLRRRKEQARARAATSDKPDHATDSATEVSGDDSADGSDT